MNTTDHDLFDEFVDRDGHALIRDPLKRALLQHDLWFVFDWLAQDDHHGRRALRSRVAKAIRQLALTKLQIEQLPDTYLQAIESKTFATALFKVETFQLLSSRLLDEAVYFEEASWKLG